MAGNRIFAFLIICMLICACSGGSNREVYCDFVSVTDSKPQADSLYEEWSKYGPSKSARYLELQYQINNRTDEDMYFPLSTWNDSVSSYVKVYFTTGKDTINPSYIVKKYPGKIDHISSGDSIIFFVEIFNFDEWGRNGIDANAELDTLLQNLHIEYMSEKSNDHDKEEPPTLIFGKSPRLMFAIPPGGTWCPIL